MAVARGSVKLWELPINWLLVMFGNLGGVLLYAALMGESRYIKHG